MADVEPLTVRREVLALNAPFANARTEWLERSALLVTLHDEDGHHGRGEAAPLPGYSQEALVDCERALLAIPRSRLTALSDESSPGELLARVAELFSAEVPAARFALETAALDRLGRRSRRPLWSLLRAPELGSTASVSVEVCALLDGSDPTAALAEALRRTQDGVRTFKLKIGPQRLQPKQLETLDLLRENLGEGVKLRLDANGSLGLVALQETLQRLADFAPEFVEEPLSEPDFEAYAVSPCALALDESLQTLDLASVEQFLQLPSAHALVLKPTSLGGFARCSELARLCTTFSRHVVVSHALEGRVGWAACAHLAIALGSPLAAGLWPLPHQQASSPRLLAGRLIPDDAPGLGAST